MSQERLQAYFDKYPVKKIGHGSDVIAYGAEHLVIKQPNPDALQMVETQSSIVSGAYRGNIFRGSKRLADDAMKLGDVLGQKTRSNYRKARETLGGLVVPYEIPDEIVARVR